MTIGSSLPGILRWFEVIHNVIEEVPPIRFACETMETVNAELRQLIAVHSADPKQNINPLSMRLQVKIWHRQKRKYDLIPAYNCDF